MGSEAPAAEEGERRDQLPPRQSGGPRDPSERSLTPQRFTCETHHGDTAPLLCRWQLLRTMRRNQRNALFLPIVHWSLPSRSAPALSPDVPFFVYEAGTQPRRVNSTLCGPLQFTPG